MAKKKELKEVKEVIKAPLLRDGEEATPETDVRPFVVNFGKSWLKCTNVTTITEQDPETGTERLVVTMQFDGQLNGSESSEILADEVVMASNI